DEASTDERRLEALARVPLDRCIRSGVLLDTLGSLDQASRASALANSMPDSEEICAEVVSRFLRRDDREELARYLNPARERLALAAFDGAPAPFRAKAFARWALTAFLEGQSAKAADFADRAARAGPPDARLLGVQEALKGLKSAALMPGMCREIERFACE